MQLQLWSDDDQINLDLQVLTGWGPQAIAGVTGLGLPPVQVQWRDAAGDGASFRARRVLPRDIDLPIDIREQSHGDLAAFTSRLAKMFANGCRLILIDDEGATWYTDVHRTGGGDYVKGRDDREGELQLIITVRAGDPFWTALDATTITIGGGSSSTAAPFIANLLTLPVSSSQAIGSVSVDNTGDAEAFPFWTIVGPGQNLEIRLPSGEGFKWLGTLSAGQTLFVDTKVGTIVDQSGASRYSSLDTAPRFFRLPPGSTTVLASMESATSASKITCSWRPRKWMVI